MDYSIFRDRINYLFNGRGLSIRGLAADLGISTPTLSRYLSGDRAPDLPYLLRIADYFHVSTGSSALRTGGRPSRTICTRSLTSIL